MKVHMLEVKHTVHLGFVLIQYLYFLFSSFLHVIIIINLIENSVDINCISTYVVPSTSVHHDNYNLSIYSIVSRYLTTAKCEK